MTEERISPLRQRMIEDMRIRGMGEKAQKSHIRAPRQAQRFLAAPYQINIIFCPRRYRLNAIPYRMTGPTHSASGEAMAPKRRPDSTHRTSRQPTEKKEIAFVTHITRPDYLTRLQFEFDYPSHWALGAKGMSVSGFANMLRPEQTRSLSLPVQIGISSSIACSGKVFIIWG